MQFWKQTDFTLRRYLNADVSGPVHYNEQNEFDREVKIFSELCREDITFNEYVDIITQLSLLQFNYFNSQHLDYNQFLSKYF